METTIELDKELLETAIKLSGITSQKEVVNLALNQFVRNSMKKQMLKYQGSNIWEGNLDEMRGM